MAYPLTGSALTGVTYTHTSGALPTSFPSTRTWGNSTFMTLSRASTVNVFTPYPLSAAVTAPSTGQMWPRGGRTNAG